jgi:uncharacterized metal-binding protein YceD (DUF177 family)
VSKKSEYVIQFSGLEDGEHQFQFKIGNSFFEQLDYSSIDKANIEVIAVLDKKPNMLQLSFSVIGKVEVMCDKCTDNFNFPIEGEDEIIYQFNDEVSNDEKIISIPENEVEVDFSQPFYEFISILIPSRTIHPEGDCNQEMLKVMDNYLIVESEDVISEDQEEDDDEVDPRWAALNKLKNKN